MVMLYIEIRILSFSRYSHVGLYFLENTIYIKLIVLSYKL